MITIATTLLWIFLIAFFILAVYSAKDVGFNFGEPRTELDANHNMLFSLPVFIDNKGYHDIEAFNITTIISDSEGFMAQGSTFIPIIERGREIIATHNATIDLNELSQTRRFYLFNDTELQVHAIIGMELASVIPVQASTDFSIPWGAPLYNFTIGEIEFTVLNLTYSMATISVNFENHAFFDLTGSILMRMYNHTSILISEGRTTIDALQNMPYLGKLDLAIPITGITENGHFEVYFSTPVFDFGPMVITYD